MIPRSHFTQIADRDEVDAKTVERDYVLRHMVTALSAEDADHGLVFKGGTALRLCHFEGYCHSAGYRLRGLPARGVQLPSHDDRFVRAAMHVAEIAAMRAGMRWHVRPARLLLGRIFIKDAHQRHCLAG